MPTASHATARSLVDEATRAGARPTALAALAVPPSALERPGRVPIDRMYRAWTALVGATGDPAIGVRAAQRWTLDELGVLGFCVAAAPTLGDAIDTAAAYVGLVTDSGTWHRDDARGEVRLVWSRSGPPSAGAAVSNEVMVSAFVRCLREMFPRTALRVTWRHPRWQPRSRHAELLGCDVGFAAADDGIVLAARDLAAVATSAHPALWRFLCDLAERDLAAIAPPSVVDRARAAITFALDRHGGRPDAAAIARSLGTSERSLRRHLASEGTTIRALIADACLERGAALLDRRTSITAAALDSGFSDATAFTRAWRRRHGLPPSRSRP